jgi:hypothetical protein
VKGSRTSRIYLVVTVIIVVLQFAEVPAGILCHEIVCPCRLRTITCVVNPALRQIVCARLIFCPKKLGTIQFVGVAVGIGDGIGVGVLVGVGLGVGCGVGVGVAVDVGVGVGVGFPNVLALATFE